MRCIIKSDTSEASQRMCGWHTHTPKYILIATPSTLSTHTQLNSYTDSSITLWQHSICKAKSMINTWLYWSWSDYDRLGRISGQVEGQSHTHTHTHTHTQPWPGHPLTQTYRDAMYRITGCAAASVMKRKVDVLLPPSICADRSDLFLGLIIQFSPNSCLLSNSENGKCVFVAHCWYLQMEIMHQWWWMELSCGRFALMWGVGGMMLVSLKTARH